MSKSNKDQAKKLTFDNIKVEDGCFAVGEVEEQTYHGVPSVLPKDPNQSKETETKMAQLPENTEVKNSTFKNSNVCVGKVKKQTFYSNENKEQDDHKDQGNNESADQPMDLR